MKLHTRTLDESTIREAGRLAGCGFIRLALHGSRTHGRAYDVILSGNGVSGGQYGMLDGKTATWDEWGIFLAALYRRDPQMRSAYENGEHFDWSTGHRYDGLAPTGQHLRHKWQHNGDALTGSYAVQQCRGCGAIKRFVIGSRRWEDIVEHDESAYRESDEHYAGAYDTGRDYAEEYLAVCGAG